MTDRRPPAPASREDRLRAALRANLARRKAQARQRAAADATGTGPTDDDSHNDQPPEGGQPVTADTSED